MSPKLVSVLLMVAMAAVAAQAEEGPATKKVWNFDADAANAPPAGFLFGKTGSGRPGNWVVRAESDAPNAPNVLAQIDTHDTTFTDAGKVGVWTKADSLTYFDNLTAVPLAGQP